MKNEYTDRSELVDGPLLFSRYFVTYIVLMDTNTDNNHLMVMIVVQQNSKCSFRCAEMMLAHEMCQLIV